MRQISFSLFYIWKHCGLGRLNTLLMATEVLSRRVWTQFSLTPSMWSFYLKLFARG